VIERPETGWRKVFLYSSIALTEQMQNFSFDFDCTETDSKSRLLFYFGLMAGDVGGGRHTICFDAIRLEELTVPAD
jgi:hypothetical protein